jgi:hypothetical protein
MISHKPLKSISHNFSHSFISLMNYINDDFFLGHLLKQARLTKINRLSIDILQNKAEPKELLAGNVVCHLSRPSSQLDSLKYSF